MLYFSSSVFIISQIEPQVQNSEVSFKETPPCKCTCGSICFSFDFTFTFIILHVRIPFVSSTDGRAFLSEESPGFIGQGAG